MAATAGPAAAQAALVAPPSNLRATQIGVSTVDLAWNPSPTAGVTEYELYANGSLLSRKSGTARTATNLTPNTGYTFTVRAIKRGLWGSIQRSTPSNAVTVTTPRDTTPPNPPTLHQDSRTATAVTLRWNGNGDNDTGGTLDSLVFPTAPRR